VLVVPAPHPQGAGVVAVGSGVNSGYIGTDVCAYIPAMNVAVVGVMRLAVIVECQCGNSKQC